MPPSSTAVASALQPPPPASFPHSLPPPVLRLLSLSSPVVNALHSFIHLATWTQPHGGGTSSCLLLLVWSLTCLYAYPILRYAPQVLLLTVILASAVPNVLLPKRSNIRKDALAGVPTLASQTLTQGQTDLLLQKLSDILDVNSSIHANLILPLWQALTWQHPGGPGVTIGTAIMATVLGTFGTICFADWPTAWSRAVAVLPLNSVISRISLILQTLSTFAKVQIYDAYLKQQVEPRLASLPALALLQAYTAKAYNVTAPHFIAVYQQLWPRSLSLSYFPPFPLFSLSLRHAVLTLGLVAFSWCSTYATLVRHALWKSASVRRVVRAFIRATSFGYLGGPEPAGFYPGRDLRAVASRGQSTVTTSTSSSASPGAPPSRVNTVPYRFELYENQRWWVGLDWTAALLPQERPSWTDSSLSPVSPPSSFTLPAESVQWRPKPTKQKPNAWEKRTIRWRWEEDEWHVVVNVGGGLGLGAGETPKKGAARRASDSPAGASASSSTGSTLFSGFPSSKSSTSGEQGGSASPPAATSGASSDSAIGNAGIVGSPSAGTADEDFAEDYAQETDPSGWRYGDNGWEKMTNRSGMGKYTRRRKWVRRARMEEVVIEGLDRPATDESRNEVEAGRVTSADSEKEGSKRAVVAAEDENEKRNGAHSEEQTTTATSSTTTTTTTTALAPSEASALASKVISQPTSPTVPTKLGLKSRLSNATSSPS